MQLYLHLSNLIASALAVDITFRFPRSPFPSQQTRGPQTCTNLLPGHCCVPVPSYPAYDNIPSSGDAFGYQVELKHLANFHLGIAWAEYLSDTWRSTVGFPGFRVDIPGCTTQPWQTRLGPGSYNISDAPADRWAAVGSHYPIGAQYLVLPQGGLPAEGPASNWL
ncbi:MAG: hypothetical protein LQ352_006275, partial [Teloschistes flavicans]